MKPKLINIVKADQVSKMALLIMIFSWALCLWTVLYPFLPEAVMRYSPLNRNDAPTYIKSALGITFLAIPLVAVRVLSALRAFNNSVEITGSIKVLRIRGSRGYVIYTYNYDGKEYSRTTGLDFSIKLKSLFREGGPIALAVNRSKPGQALIRDLYFP